MGVGGTASLAPRSICSGAPSELSASTLVELLRRLAPQKELDMDETKIEKLAHLSGKAASKALGALERRGFKLRDMLSAPISRIPRREPPKTKMDD